MIRDFNGKVDWNAIGAAAGFTVLMAVCFGFGAWAIHDCAVAEKRAGVVRAACASACGDDWVSSCESRDGKLLAQCLSNEGTRTIVRRVP